MKDPVDQVTCSRVIRYVPHEYQLDNRTGKDLAQYPAQDAGNTVHQPLRVGLLDYGLKHNILRHLLKRGCQVTRFPARTTAEEIIKADLDGIMLSNGPGDPKDCESSIQTIRELWGRLPIFGICLGHQLTALSQGADTGRLKYGHRGANHPVKDLTTGRTYITSQNHGYAVLPESLDKNRIRITHINMNDGTVEGLKFLDAPVFTVQFHPEACPGPQDTAYLFDRFIASMRGTLPNAKT
jgi:carbamoyl-phosphate synthase small subunit